MPRQAATPSPVTDTGHAHDYVAVALRYAESAAADRAGKRHGLMQRLAAKRFLADLKRSRRRNCAFTFDPWHGNDVCDFIEKLPHVKGTFATPTITLEPVQCFILVNIFGFRLKSNGRRRFTTVYIEMARKGAKSTLTAGVVLYCFTCEGEEGPDVVVGATTRQQADKVFQPIQQMVKKTGDLKEAFGLRAWANAISCLDNGGSIQPINSKSETQDGWNPYMGVLDELHAHKSRGLFDVIDSAFGARVQPLFWLITTAGFDTNGVCYEQHSLVEKVLKGVLAADHYYGIIFTLDEGDSPLDESKWVKANPLIGVSPKWEVMRSAAIEASANPGKLAEFKTKRLNMWLNAASVWLSVERWKKAEVPGLSMHDFKGLDVTIGCDLADKDDLASVVLTAERDDEQLLVKPFFFLPAAALVRHNQSDRNATTYGVWAGKYRVTDDAGAPIDDDELEGLPALFNPAPMETLPEEWKHPLLVTPGDFIDHTVIEDLLAWLIETLSVSAVVGDQFAGWQTMASRINERFATPDAPLATILHKSAANVTDPAKDIEARVTAGPKRIGHDGNPVLTWNVGNAVVSRYVNGSILPKKETADSPNKIDGLDALINANAPRVIAKEPERAQPRIILL